MYKAKDVKGNGFIFSFATISHNNQTHRINSNSYINNSQSKVDEGRRLNDSNWSTSNASEQSKGYKREQFDCFVCHCQPQQSDTSQQQLQQHERREAFERQ
jgi:hypothetical protein